MSDSPENLIVLLGGAVAGTVERKGDQMKFIYDEQWRQSRAAYPLSLSMPLASREHSTKAISAFMWGLLPDNEFILGRWARQFQVSPRNPFALLANMGEDCAGAIQFTRPDRVDTMLDVQPALIDWLDDEQLAGRLASLIADHGTGRAVGDNGQFSLAGAQPKTALLRSGGRWGVPSGRIPTTHILKPPSPEFDGMAENEHFCLSLADALGLKAASSEVVSVNGVQAIAVSRYDRHFLSPDDPATIVRLHQEDLCQAMGITPGLKYQNEGGPSAASAISLIESSIIPFSAGRPAGQALDGGRHQDVWTFLSALILNWIIGGTDAHAKNYSFLIGSGGLVRLAPLYDILSAYGFPHIAPQKMKLAMKIGSKYGVEEIVLRHWRDWAKEAKVDPDALVARIADMAARFPDALDRTRAKMRDQGLVHPVIDRLHERLLQRAEQVAAMQ
jgi:serine/threonine-protein kinase HipA